MKNDETKQQREPTDFGLLRQSKAATELFHGTGHIRKRRPPKAFGVVAALQDASRLTSTIFNPRRVETKRRRIPFSSFHCRPACHCAPLFIGQPAAIIP